jgi:DNA-directed RNA polymerase subunit RPC12/RpoP
MRGEALGDVITFIRKMSDILIEYQCPQCGAPAILKETDRLFACEFCRVKSYLFQKDFFRYMLPNSAPKNKDLLFFPYWRFKGMVFSCVEDGIKHRFIDFSHQAVESGYFPVSVGLRSQALKLNFVTPESQGYFLRPTQPFKNVMSIFNHRFTTSLPHPIFHQSHIGETLSLIYSPYYANDKIFDAILNQPVSSDLPDNFNVTLLQGGRPDGRIHFIPTLCPDCGWDLEGRRDALVLNCKNCHSVWRPTANGFKKLRFATLPTSQENIIYLPFWRIKAGVTGIALNSYADLVRIANIPKAIKKKWEDVEFRFWTLAFKVRPQIFLRLARNLTLAQPQEKLVRELPDTRFHPVTLPIEEAIESLTVNLAGFMKPQKDLFPMLRDITITPKSYLLVYIPLIEQHHEVIHPEFHLNINKNQLDLASNL